MAAPRFTFAHSGNTDAGGAWSYSIPAGYTGEVVILQVLQDGGTSSAVALTSVTNIEDLAGTDSSMTYIGAFGASSTVLIQHLWIGRRMNTSAGNVGGSNSTSEDLYIRSYTFDDVSSGTTLATVIENGTAGTATEWTSGSTSTVQDANVTTLGTDRLALNFIAVNDDNAIAQFSGQTGGTWVEVPEYASASGTDGAVQLQWAYLGVGYEGTLDTGSSVIGTGGTSEECAQSFTCNGGSVTGVVLYLAKNSAPSDNLIVEIQTDSGGVPSGTVVGSSGSIASSDVASSYTTRFISLDATLSSSTTYWLVCRRSGSRDTGNYFYVSGDSAGTYASGQAASRSSGTWSAVTGVDLQFHLLIGSGSTIGGGSASITDADGVCAVGFALIGTTPSQPRVPFFRIYPQILAH